MEVIAEAEADLGTPVTLRPAAGRAFCLCCSCSVAPGQQNADSLCFSNMLRAPQSALTAKQ